MAVGVRVFLRRLPALRVGQEELDGGSVDPAARGERIGRVDVRADDYVAGRAGGFGMGPGYVRPLADNQSAAGRRPPAGYCLPVSPETTGCTCR